MKTWLLRAPLLGATLFLCGCGSLALPEIVTKFVDRTVAVSCVPDLGAEPVYVDTREALLAAPHPGAEERLRKNPKDAMARKDVTENLHYRVRLLLAGRIQRMGRDKQKTVALEACAKGGSGGGGN